VISALCAALVDLIILAMVVRCAHAILWQLPTDHLRVARVVGHVPERIARLGAEDSALGRLARAASSLEPGDDLAVALREVSDELRSFVGDRLAWLRLLGPAASCIGLAGAAAQMSWMRADHGVLDLDPDRVLAMAVESGSLCMALGIAGSTTVIGALLFLRPRARALHDGMTRFAEQLLAGTPAKPPTDELTASPPTFTGTTG
jgi:hypothetical protein